MKPTERIKKIERDRVTLSRECTVKEIIDYVENYLLMIEDHFTKNLERELKNQNYEDVFKYQSIIEAGRSTRIQLLTDLRNFAGAK